MIHAYRPTSASLPMRDLARLYLATWREGLAVLCAFALLLIAAIGLEICYV